jgi:hypothetical protein
LKENEDLYEAVDRAEFLLIYFYNLGENLFFFIKFKKKKEGMMFVVRIPMRMKKEWSRESHAPGILRMTKKRRRNFISYYFYITESQFQWQRCSIPGMNEKSKKKGSSSL